MDQFFAVVARRKRWPGQSCDAEFPILYRSVGFAQGRVEVCSGA